ENARIARENIARRWKNETLKKRVRKVKYRVGDHVRISRAKGKNDIFRNIEEWRKNIMTEKANQSEDEQATAEEKKDLPKFDSTTDRDKANTNVSQTSSIFENSTTHIPAKELWTEPISVWAAMDRANQNATFNYLVIIIALMQPSWFTVSFVRGITEKFSRLNSEHMRISFYSVNKLREFIRMHKDPLPRDKKSKVAYKILCKSCDASYVGQTCRQLKSRITECKNHIQWNTSARNVIMEHRLQEGHDFDWNNIVILDEEPHYRKRFISEMIFIRRQTHGLNLQMDMEGLPKAYLPIIDKL
ncbi:hypothetical protein ALC57_01134, partial [Trachymyrmex cornetzi]